jgi:DNA-binding MarR family transcriptional regulator
MKGLYQKKLKEFNLTFTQFMVLGLLWEEDGQTIKTLGKTLRLDSGTLTPLIKRLELANLVIRNKSTIDERSNIINLTEKGMALKAKGIAAGEIFYENLMLEENEMSILKEILTAWIERQSSEDASKI